MLRRFHPQFLTAYSWLAQFSEKFAVALKDNFQMGISIENQMNEGALHCLQMFYDFAATLDVKVQAQKIEGVKHLVASKLHPTGSRYSGNEGRWLLRELHTIVLDFNRELEGWQMLAIPPHQAKFLGNVEALHPFGEEVTRAFPESQYELVEAYRCLAFDCNTACVMHLMRALEGPVRALARLTSVPDNTSWGPLLEKVQAKVKDSIKSAEDAKRERWKVDICQYLLAIKDAWRNEAAHGRHKYTAEEAETVLVNVRALMQISAKNLAQVLDS